MIDHGSWQMGVYQRGLAGERPSLPMQFAELERRAHETLSPELVSYVAGGAGDGRTHDVNVAEFDRWGIVPRMLAGATERDLSVELLGHTLPSPLLLAPVGVIGLCTPDGHGDIATAQAAAHTGVPMIASTLTEDPLEEVAAQLGETPGFFQLYTPDDRELAASLVARAEKAGFSALVVTLDTWRLGWRPRDLALASFPQLRGLCLANYTSDPVFRAKLSEEQLDDPHAIAAVWAGLFGAPWLTWDELPWLRSLTSLPIVLKGICHADDARRAVDAGIDGIFCSNHGGRQANGGVPALAHLESVVDAAGDAPVIFDSGVRDGVHVLKALALGARAVAIGRPYVYGAALAGADGIEHVLRCLLAEADLTMSIDGYSSVAALDRSAIVRLS